VIFVYEKVSFIYVLYQYVRMVVSTIGETLSTIEHRKLIKAKLKAILLLLTHLRPLGSTLSHAQVSRTMPSKHQLNVRLSFCLASYYIQCCKLAYYKSRPSGKATVHRLKGRRKATLSSTLMK